MSGMTALTHDWSAGERFILSTCRISSMNESHDLMLTVTTLILVFVCVLILSYWMTFRLSEVSGHAGYFSSSVPGPVQPAADSKLLLQECFWALLNGYKLIFYSWAVRSFVSKPGINQQEFGHTESCIFFFYSHLKCVLQKWACRWLLTANTWFSEEISRHLVKKKCHFATSNYPCLTVI